MENDVRLPDFEIVEINPQSNRLVKNYTSWGVDALDTPYNWSLGYEGSGTILFTLDTEYLTDYPKIKPALVHGYCRTFTGEQSKGLGRHGLHVSDTIRQMAPMALIALCKVLTDSGSGSSRGVADAIRYVADLELMEEHQGFKKIINLSLGSDAQSILILEALQYAISKGVFVFAAAGNDGRDVDFPGANEKQVITIGAIDKHNKPASFSSPGAAVDLSAPGVGIEAAWENGTAILNGTSMATPHAAGVAALILSAHLEISNQGELEAFMEKYAVDIHTPGEDDKTGAGLPVVTHYMPPVKPDKPPVEPPAPEDPPIPPTTPPKSGKTPWWIIALIVAFGLGAIAFFLIKFVF